MSVPADITPEADLAYEDEPFEGTEIAAWEGDRVRVSVPRHGLDLATADDVDDFILSLMEARAGAFGDREWS